MVIRPAFYLYQLNPNGQMISRTEALCRSMKVLVTGGAGFIGSHLVEALLARGDDVVALDNLSSGRLDNLRGASSKPNFHFVEADLKTFGGWNEVLDGVKLVYHFAANPEVNVGATNPAVHYQENLFASFMLLEALRNSKSAKHIVFASTSTVYGEASKLPTPEDYGPLLPISTYGASKLGCEVLLSAYSYTHGMRALILRLGNCVGSRAKHGVVVDFISKLKASASSLEILGDGTQKKSYIHIEDVVDAANFVEDRFLSSERRVDVYNLSSADQITVKRIAEIVAQEMGLHCVKMNFTGGVDGGRGWLGDVKQMHLSIRKLRRLGWTPKLNSEAAIRRAAKELLA
jgi:UDP-glucose 4-epimerase